MTPSIHASTHPWPASPAAQTAAGVDTPLLAVHDLHKAYGTPDAANRHTAIERISFSVAEGERLSIVGPSGCGKTTLLKCISGLQPVTSGTVAFRGRAVQTPPEGLSIVFQDYARSLFPWMSVEDNVKLPLKYRALPARQQTERVSEALHSVGLAAHAKRFPGQLSGGMQQRTAIARALACQPQLLLMDEPFASVDAQSRLQLEDLTMRLCEQYGFTLITITHDIDEAIYMGDKVLVLAASPSTVRAVLEVDLPDPRDQIETKLLPAFGEVRAQVYGLINHPGAA